MKLSADEQTALQKQIGDHLARLAEYLYGQGDRIRTSIVLDSGHELGITLDVSARRVRGWRDQLRKQRDKLKG